MPVTRRELENYIGQLLAVDRFRDYAPNGLQVEGKDAIGRIVTGVTASLALIEAAIEQGADALIVHHGYFWKSEDPCITRTKRTRLARLLAHDINLFAYHLPLDAHAELGNNAQLGARLGLLPTGRFAEQDLGWLGVQEQPLSFTAFARRVEEVLGRAPLEIGEADKLVQRVAWCTGGAQGYFHEAAALDIDCFLTGEASEFVTHLANESGIGYIAAGHHATEQFGIAALGEHLATTLGVEHVHIDLPNPV
ncbi:dinuclear metal center protein, YbgI/SA1388 family [Formivibrio citricus]|uniref:Dinuclear metal center protein, YbgI/SA1388 family n=1 Tax=Formivibrio citricus TaxID=83765 RepID=A0A1I4XUQ7_9NEIS|nr:Nif3-like dinuclear metal center hexameric protein [Formivibrio citricus]SFN29592.1 dinuclear metal center protein, YbgI/SA1388 family [Formivibrio citricus]